MTKNISLLAFLSVLFLNITNGQVLTHFSNLTVNDMPDVVINDNRIFGGESLYGYIDGGAELYLEYGFDSLMVTDLTFKGNDIKIEIFRMSDPDASFGIFSVLHFRCSDGVMLTKYYCSNKYQLQFSKACFYVSIVNSNGTDTEKKLSETIASSLIERITGPSFDPAAYFTDDLTSDMLKSAVLVRGPLGLFNGANGMSAALEESIGYSAMILKGDAPVISVHFNTVELMNAFIEKEQIDISALKKGEEVTGRSGEKVSMICIQGLLLKTK